MNNVNILCKECQELLKYYWNFYINLLQTLGVPYELR